MKKSLALVFGVLAALLMAPSANAAITEVFQHTSSPLSCAQDGTYTYCGSPDKNTPTTVASFDGTPIDTVVGLPTSLSLHTSAGYPVVGYYHGWGGNKVDLKNDATAQGLLQAGFIVISITDRGWGNSCGGPAVPVGGASKSWPCTQGYIHLMHNAYEVRDAQYLIGQLADDVDSSSDPIIDPAKVGATGGSYGGGISEALAMLKDRIQLPNGQLVSWQSPQGKSMAIAGATPQYTWSDLAASLAPNGSTLDYAKYNPYNGPSSDRRTGIPKQQWLFNLYASGAQAGYYAPIVGTGYPDPAANIIGWYGLLTTGGPFDGNSSVDSALSEIETNHSAYYIPINNSTHTPAPMLISGGWNDDLFPFNEAVRLYNKVRTDAPSVDVSLWGVDIGHTPRSNNLSAVQTADGTPLTVTQITWMVRHVAGLPLPYSAPTPVGYNENGGAVATTSACGTGANAQQRVAGAISTGSSWAAMTAGEVDVLGADEQTIEPNTSPSSPFETNNSGSGNGTGTDVCDYDQRTDDTPGAAVYTSDAAGTGGYTIMGSPTVEADLNVTGANDQIVSRLYDYDPSGVGHQRLIARGVYRPTGVDGGFSRQVFQLFPQNYTVEQGHTLKLELLSADMPFAMISKNTHQQPIDVKNLQLQVPVSDSPGAADGQVINVTPRQLPSGYAMTQDALSTDSLDPITTDDVPGTLQKSVTVTLSSIDRGISGVDKIYYTTGATPATPTTSSTVYDPNNKPTLGDGEKISYFAVDRAGNDEAVETSIAAQVDSVPPIAPSKIDGPASKVAENSATISWTASEIGETFSCALDGAPTSACTSPATLTGLANGAHTLRVYGIDTVGNVSDPLEVSWTVEGQISTSVSISGTVKIGKTITAKTSDKAFGSSLSGVKHTFSWSANGKKVGSKSQLKLSSKWKGKKIAVKVTAKKTGYKSGTATKTATSKLK